MNDYLFKTEPYDHQRERFYLYRDKEYHAHLWEQRTGKSKITIDTAAWRYAKGDIDALLVIAPCGVHLNWVRNEIPTHMPDHTGCDPVVWLAEPKAAERKRLEALQKNSTAFGLRCLSMNIEALNSPRGLAFAKSFLMNYRTMLVIDEGSTIKSMTAGRTKAALNLSIHAPVRRLLNGTPVTQSPLDVYPQFTFLDENILGSSYVSFRSEYATMEMQGKMWYTVKRLLDDIAARLGSYCWGELQQSEDKGVISAGYQPLDSGVPIEFKIKQMGKTHWHLLWTCGRESGLEKMTFDQGSVYQVITGFRNLDKLQSVIKPHSDRVLKKDCLDLPDKIYQKHYVELSAKQQKMYNDIKKECIAQTDGLKMTATLAFTKMLRCQQIVGGFFTPDIDQFNLEGGVMEELEDFIIQKLDRHAIPIEDKNPRIESLLTEIEERWEGKILIWARFTAEIKEIARALRAKYGKEEVVELYGEIDSNTRQQSIDNFRFKDSPRFAVANPACKGVSRGQNMCSASFEIYYSNSFSLEDRLQSEDRPHSPGLKNNLGVIDFIAPGTLDEKVIDALRNKKNLADEVTGDSMINWI